MAYANPDAVTQIANGVSTTTFSYDNNGNLIQKTTDGTSTTYVYDYANRLIALGYRGATTTYGYDAFEVSDYTGKDCSNSKSTEFSGFPNQRKNDSRLGWSCCPALLRV